MTEEFEDDVLTATARLAEVAPEDWINVYIVQLGLALGMFTEDDLENDPPLLDAQEILDQSLEIVWSMHKELVD